MFKKMMMSVVIVSLGFTVAANAAVSVVGEDTVTKSNWRTAAALESDNEYGTDGYAIYGFNAADGVYSCGYDISTANGDNLISLPGYISEITLAQNTCMWSGNGNFGQIEDPANGNALSNTPLVANGDGDPWVFTIQRNSSAAFRLTVMLSNGDAAPSQWITTVDDGTSASYDFSVPDTSSATYYVVFDVSAGSGPVTVEVEYVPGGSQFDVTGFAFDSASELAGAPAPGNDALDVLRDVVLTWTPGQFAAQHHVYFGDDFDTVGSATVPTSAGLDVNSFDAGRLEFGKTYYWRVDEVNGTPDKTVFEGDVWSFTVEPYSIRVPSDGITVTASSSSNEFSTPDKTIDGSGLDADDRHDIAPETMWFTAAVDLDPWIQYEFDDVMKLDVMNLWNSNGAAEVAIGWGVKDVEIATSVDGVTWDVLADANQFSRAPGLPTYDQYDTIDFAGATAKYVRLNIQSNWGGILMSYGLSEVQFFSIPAAARTPDPASGAGDVLPDTVVTWRSGREAAQHTIYLGTDPNAVADGSAPSVQSGVNSLDLSTLDLQLGQTYYWRVDEVNEAEATSVWAGPVWELSTAAWLVVEDFERYGNMSPHRPFQTWLDGFGYSADEFFPVAYGGNGTGAAIGHDIWSLSSPHYDGSIMETDSTIPGSSQALPFYYTNTGGTASETQREFADPQDWTVGNPQTLSIAFRGQPENTGTLYVKINNTKVTYPRNPSNLALKQWQAWNIDLASVGANLEAVTTLAIGVEGNGAAGMLLIDDIILHPDAGQMITPTAPGDGNLVAYYALDGNVNDGSGNGVHGTEMGLPVYEAGVQGQAIRLNGIDDFVDFGVPQNWPSGAAPRTLCAWAKTFSVEPGWRVIAAYGSPSGAQATALVMNGTLLGGSGYGSDISINGFWAVDEWHHVGLTYDGATLLLYADGIQVASGQRDWNTNVTVARIGRQVNEANEFWDGLVDEVRLYDTVLSADEMAWLGGKTAPIDKPF